MAIRVTIVDGHTLTRYGLAGLIAEQADIEVAGQAATVAEAMRAIAMEGPDVVTIDAVLPDGDGLELARGLRDRLPALGIVALTSRDDDEAMFEAMASGVSAFVAKTAAAEEVLAAIRHSAVAPSSFTASGLALAMARQRDGMARSVLSPREHEALRLLGDGRSIPELAAHMYVSPSTAKTYVARVYEKLGASNRAQAIMTALHRGLLHHEIPSSA